MRRWTKCGVACALAFAAVICCGPAFAQQDAQQVFAGAPSVIVLPSKIVAGESATLAVLDAEGRLVPHAAVAIAGRSDKIATDDTGRAMFSAPTQAGTGVLTASLPGGGDFTATLVLPPTAAPQATSEGTRKEAAHAASMIFPRRIALGDHFRLAGTGFSGDANLDHIFLGNQEALVLAASSIDLEVLPDARTPLGHTQLIVQIMGLRLATEPITVVSIEITGPFTGAGKPEGAALAAREKGKVVVEVNGTSGRVNVEVRNLSPDVVRLSRANDVTIATSGGIPNVAEVPITAVKTGDYSLTARLVPDVTFPAR
jgi:hypothetical protein